MGIIGERETNYGALQGVRNRDREEVCAPQFLPQPGTHIISHGRDKSDWALDNFSTMVKEIIIELWD